MSIFPIPGINSNIAINGNICHVQTEVLPGKKVVATQIYIEGTIIHSDFVSFNKHYNALINSNPDKLRSGIIKLVKMQHQKNLSLLKNEKLSVNDDNERISLLFSQWVENVYMNLFNDYGDKMSLYLFEDNKNFKRFNKKDNFHFEKNIIKFMDNYSKKIRNFIPVDYNFSFMNIDNYKIYFLPVLLNNSIIIIFDKEILSGAIRLDLNVYISLYKEFIVRNKINNQIGNSYVHG